jgi:hypothetical protein
MATRTLGTCVDSWCPWSCTSGNYFTKAVWTNTLNTVGAAALALCDQQNDQALINIQSAYEACMVLAGLIALTDPPAGAAAAIACIAAHNLDLSNQLCYYNNCKHDCATTGPTYSLAAAGCP